jgi:hypothetical protein
MEKELLNDSGSQQGKTYIGQVQADCFCQVNILGRQTNPTILIKIRSSYLLICFAWPLQTHSIDGVLLSIWTRKKRHHRYSFANYTLKLTARTKRYDKRDDFDFPLWIFHLCVTTFQHHLHMEYAIQTSGSYLDFRERGLLLINKYWTKCSWWLGCKDHFKSFTVIIMTWLTIKEYLSYEWPWLCFPLSWFIIGFIARVTLEEQGLVPSILPLVLSGDRDAQSFVFCVVLSMSKSSWWLGWRDHFKSFTVIIMTRLTRISVYWVGNWKKPHYRLHASNPM